MDDGDVTQATVITSPIGLVLLSTGSLGSCKFRGESYVCQNLIITHPSGHTIEGVQADDEVTALFKKPTGEMMQLSSLIRISSAQTPSLSFFKQFVPYIDPNAKEGTSVALNQWSLSALVPPEASYYVYNGSTITGDCSPCECVVFKSMINMDQGDFAYLVKNIQAGSRPVQALGDREVFFNDTNNVPGGPMPHDGKFYLRLRPTGDSKLGKPVVKPINLDKSTDPAPVDDTTLAGQMRKAVSDYTEKYGVAGIILGAITVIAAGFGAYYGYQYSKEKPITGESTVPYAKKTREYAWWVVTKIWSLITWVFTAIYGAFTWIFNAIGTFFSAIFTVATAEEETLVNVDAGVERASKTFQNTATAAAATAELAAAQATKKLADFNNGSHSSG
jgi:hypothetical protein